MDFMVERHFNWNGIMESEEVGGVFSIIVRTSLSEPMFTMVVLNGAALPASALMLAEDFINTTLKNGNAEWPRREFQWTIVRHVNPTSIQTYMVREKQDRWSADGLFIITDRPIVARVRISSKWKLNEGVTLPIKHLPSLNAAIFSNDYNYRMNDSVGFETKQREIFGNDDELIWNSAD